jgi:phosphoribosylformylglycinamidine synthase
LADVVSKIPLSGLSDAELVALSRKLLLSLNVDEMRMVRNYFAKEGREPSDAELETIAQTWSEHCKHKVFNSVIEYSDEESGKTETVRSLFKTFIRGATENVAKKKKWLVSVFKDNAGVIRFDDSNDIAFKVETHNHPSALDPFGGAGTGIGGVIRDVLGVGLGARPIFNTDVFCFAPPDFPAAKVPKTVLHPKRIFKGVVDGVRAYGNPMGIPTINGSVHFDERYLGNPLVYCGTCGIMPKGMSEKQARPGDAIVAIGGRTGRDGIHGATFSSVELEESTSSSAVQIGNPVEEKKFTDVLVRVRDKGLYDAITDCGAGGFSSAIGEMAQETGARVYLERAPLKYEGLLPWEIWVSEAQERMILSVPRGHLEEFVALCESEDVEATILGEFTGDGVLNVTFNDEPVVLLDMEFLHGGLPIPRRHAVWKKKNEKEPSEQCPKDLTKDLKNVLSEYDVCSKEWVVRRYDHEVQASSALKPFVGAANDGPSDASIVCPVLGSRRAVVVSNGINVHFGKIDAYWMAASAIDEALRNLVATGAPLGEVAILDNFCWGSPDKPEQLADLVRACQAAFDFAVAFETPFISGKDSFYNEYKAGDKTIAIPPTLLISAIAVMPDACKAVSMDAKKAGNAVYVVGETKNEMGGSQYWQSKGFLGNSVPKVDAKKAVAAFNSLHNAMGAGFVASCHDCSEGGLAVALAEMAFAGGLGMEVDLKKVPASKDANRNDAVLFSESNSRFVVEVKKGCEAKFEKILNAGGVAFGKVGQISAGKEFVVAGLDGKTAVRAGVDDLKRAWKKPLDW